MDKAQQLKEELESRYNNLTEEELKQLRKIRKSISNRKSAQKCKKYTYVKKYPTQNST